MRFPKLVAVATMTMLALAACGAAATPAPAGQAAPTPASSGAATVAAATAAAGGGASASAVAGASAPAGNATNPCSLLSAADLNTVTGAKFAEGVFDATYDWCEWDVPEADGGGNVLLAISDNPFATVKGVLTQGVDLTVSGHPAFWDPESGVTSMLVDLGVKTLELSFPKATREGAIEQAMAQKLAEMALSKM